VTPHGGVQAYKVGTTVRGRVPSRSHASVIGKPPRLSPGPLSFGHSKKRCADLSPLSPSSRMPPCSEKAIIRRLTRRWARAVSSGPPRRPPSFGDGPSLLVGFEEQDHTGVWVVPLTRTEESLPSRKNAVMERGVARAAVSVCASRASCPKPPTFPRPGPVSPRRSEVVTDRGQPAGREQRVSMARVSAPILRGFRFL